MAWCRLVKPVAGADVRIDSVLNPFLGLCGGKGVRNKSPLTLRGCERGAMHMDLSTLGWCIPKRSCEAGLVARWGL